MEFHFLPFFFLGLGGPSGTWGGAATRGVDAMRGSKGLNIM